MSDQKQLRFQMVVDQASVQQFGNAISLMTKQLEALTKAIGAASQAMGGLLGGGHVGGAKTGSTVQAGGGSVIPGAAPAPNVATGTSGGGPKAASLSDVFLKNSAAFKGMADSSKQSMKVMTDGLSQAVRDSETKLQRLNAELARVAQSYEKAAAAGSRFAGTKQDLMMDAANIQTQIAGEQKNLGGLQALQPEASQGRWQRFKGWVGSNGGAGWNGAGAAGGGTSALQSGVNSLLGGGVVAAIAAAVRLGVSAADGIRGSRMIQGTAEGDRGSLLGGRAVSAWGGDYRGMYARMLIARDSGATEDARNAAGNGFGNNLVYGAGRAWNIGKNVLTGGVGPAGLGIATMGHDMELDKMKDLETQVENKMRANALDMVKVQSFFDSASGRTARDRRLGYSYGRKAAGAPLFYGAGNTAANWTGLGIDEGSAMAALSSVAAIGGERAGHANAARVALANARGFGGAASLVGLSAQGPGENYVRSVFGAMGHRGGYGADMQAAGGLGVGLLERMSGQGQGMYDQSAVFGAAMNSGLYSGHGTDMLANRQIMGGLDALNRRYSGSIDGYGKGMNVRAVASAMGGASPQAKDYVATQMSFERMVSIASGKVAPNEVERALGITPAQVARVMEIKSNDSVRRIHGAGLGGGTLAGRVASAIQSSGMTTMEWARSHKGFSQKDTLAGLAAIGVATSGVTADAAYGEAGILMGLGKTQVAKLRKSGGLSDVRGEGEKAKDEADAKRQKELNDTYAENQKTFAAMAKEQQNYIKEYDKASKDMTVSAERLNESFLALSRNIDALVVKQGGQVKHALDSQGARGTGGNTSTAGKK